MSASGPHAEDFSDEAAQPAGASSPYVRAFDGVAAQCGAASL